MIPYVVWKTVHTVEIHPVAVSSLTLTEMQM